MSDLRDRLRKFDEYTPPPGGRPSLASQPTNRGGSTDDSQMFESLAKKKAKRRKVKKPKRARPKRNWRKVLGYIFVIFILAGTVGGGYVWLNQHKKVKSNTANQEGESSSPSTISVNQSASPTTIRLIGVGDMVPHAAIIKEADKGGGKYDFEPMLHGLKQFFQTSDIRVCTQETPAGGTSFGISGHPTFNAPLEWPQALESAGCNVINLGTNHMNDKGQPLIDATVAAWDNKPSILAVTGANRSAEEQSKVHYFTVKGVKFAFLSYTTATNNKTVSSYGVNLYSDALVQAQMKEARAQADFVVVGICWGKEASPDTDESQVKYAQQLSDLGADIIFGEGPQFVQPVQKLIGSGGKETVVWYSLGDTVNARLETEALIGGLATIDIDIASKKISKMSFMPTYMHYEWTADQKKSGDLLSRHNFSIYPLDESAPLMAKSQIGTTVDAQQTRLSQVLNKFITVPLLTGQQFRESAPKS